MNNTIEFHVSENQLVIDDNIIGDKTLVALILNTVAQKNVPTEEISEFKFQLILNQGVTYKMKERFDKWLDDKIFNHLINRKKTFYSNLINKLSVFDLHTLTDIYNNYKGFKLESIYLAGGMDEAENLGKGWRSILEHEFEIENRGKRNFQLEKVKFTYMMEDYEIHPAYVVDGGMIDRVVSNKKYLNYYDKPALLNPVRAEIKNRTANDFKENIGEFKDPEYDPNENVGPFEWISSTFGDEIEPGDEQLIRISDLIFLGQDSTAGAGTYAELELVSLMRKPVFAWLVNKSQDKIGAFKFWNIPHLSKVVRNEKEMKILVNTICREAKL